MRWKRIWLNYKKTKYCTVYLFNTVEEMRGAYKKWSGCSDPILGAHCGFVAIQTATNTLSKETGKVYLNVDHCRAGIVGHELMHAVLWAYRHNKNKKQYPIIIKSMRQEEILLHMQTFAVDQFYKWYWKVVEKK